MAEPASDLPPTQGKDEDAANPPARKPGVVGTTPDRFEPTEKVRADYDVSFPVDI